MLDLTEVHNRRQREILAAQSNVAGVEIFKAGHHKPMEGPARKFFRSQLDEIADGYNTDVYRAPVVIGHPKTDAPAYGWVESLSVENDVLISSFVDIDPEFSKLVKAKKYRKISAAFWNADAPNNPTPGKWALKHVGFLGAAAPAVNGLKEVEFGNDDSGIVSFGDDDFADLPEHHRKTIMRHENDVLLEGLISDGKLLPLHKNDIMDFVDAFDDAQSVSFSDGSESGMRDWFLNFLQRQSVVVSFGAQDMSDSVETINAPQNAPNGFSVDPDRQELQVKANQLAEVEGISFIDAVSRLEG